MGPESPRDKRPHTFPGLLSPPPLQLGLKLGSLGPSEVPKEPGAPLKLWPSFGYLWKGVFFWVGEGRGFVNEF